MKKVVLCFVILAFAYVGIHQLNSYGKEEGNYGDKITFEEKTEVGKKLVFSNNLFGYENYYVIRFTNNGAYIVHSYYYLNNKEEYINQYRNVYNRIVDYNYDNFMIRTVDGSGSLSYDEFYNLYQDLFNNGTYTIIY